MSRHCFAPGCVSGYPSEKRRNKKLGKRNPSLFSVPKDVELLEIWRKAIPRKDRVLNHCDKICELHFPEECIERTFVTKIFDGTVSIIEREKPALKNGSIPTIFPNLPYELKLSTKTSKTKFAAHHVLKKTKIQRNKNYSVRDNQNINDSFQDEIQKEQFNYMQLIEHLEQVQKPNPWWSVSQCQGFIICAKWNAEYCSDRKVVICQDLTSKVFLRNIEVPSLNKQIHSIESLTSLLLVIDKVVICEAAESGG